MMDDSLYFWDDLIQFIEEESVIPIVGQELLTVDIDGKTIPLYQHLAERLAHSLRLAPEQIQAPLNLDQVVYQFLQMPGSRRELLYRRMRSILNDLPLVAPEPLRLLAGIRPLKLFISTTCDSLLETAINEVRFKGQAVTRTSAYTLGDANDLPCEIREMRFAHGVPPVRPGVLAARLRPDRGGHAGVHPLPAVRHQAAAHAVR